MFYHIKPGGVFNLVIVKIYNDIMKKSYEQRLINKDHLPTHSINAIATLIMQKSDLRVVMV